MKRLPAVLLGLLVFLPGAQAAEVEFNNDVIPVFTKLGCNAGNCHGAALGRGGFKLSLYGGDAAADFDAVTRQLRGRRINLLRPADSLLLLKPSETLEHGGGGLISEGDRYYQQLESWIREGATGDSRRKLTRVEITPTARVEMSRI